MAKQKYEQGRGPAGFIGLGRRSSSTRLPPELLRVWRGQGLRPVARSVALPESACHPPLATLALICGYCTILLPPPLPRQWVSNENLRFDTAENDLISLKENERLSKTVRESMRKEERLGKSRACNLRPYFFSSSSFARA